MYPRLSDVFRDVFGINFPIPIYSFGAMVAVAVLFAAWLLKLELDRYYALGRVKGIPVTTSEKVRKGKNTREIVSPSMLVGTITMIALVSGFAGARIFHILENLDAFVADPIGMIFTTGGFTFFGSIIVAGFTLAWYVRKKGIPVWTFADSIAPSLMLAYGIGRIGCHLSGDGDWGIMSDLRLKPDWIPTWLWAETYPNNILHENIPFPGVYPTPLYEFAAATLLFGILWALRKHPFVNGWLFSIYLIFTGIERFLIELIRVNNRMDLFGLTVTQAEIISVLSIVLGLGGLALTWKRYSGPEAGRVGGASLVPDKEVVPRPV